MARPLACSRLGFWELRGCGYHDTHERNICRSPPPLETVAPYYDAVLELAERELDALIQTRIRTWEVGEFEIRAYHGYGPHPLWPQTTYQHVLHYHSEEREVTIGLLAIDLDTEDKTLIYKRLVGAVSPGLGC